MTLLDDLKKSFLKFKKTFESRDDNNLSMDEIKEVLNYAINTNNIDVIATIITSLPALEKMLPKTSDNKEMKLFLQRVKESHKINLKPFTPSDKELTGFYDIRDVNDFYKLEDIKENVKYINSLDRISRELIKLYWLDYDFVTGFANLALTNNKLVDIMTQIFENAPPSKNELTVYRGINIPDTELNKTDLTVLNALTSTSIDPNVGWFFKSTTDYWELDEEGDQYLRWDKCCMLKIILPKGSKFIVPTFDESDELRWQQEILLPPGGKLELIQEYIDYRNIDQFQIKAVTVKEYKYIPDIDFNRYSKSHKHKEIEMYNTEKYITKLIDNKMTYKDIRKDMKRPLKKEKVVKEKVKKKSAKKQSKKSIEKSIKKRSAKKQSKKSIEKSIKKKSAKKQSKKSIKKKLAKKSIKKKSVKKSIKKRSIKKSVKKRSVKKRSVKKSIKKRSVKKSIKKRSIKKSIKKRSVKKSIKKRSVKKSIKKRSVKKSIKKHSVKKSIKKRSVKKSIKKRSAKKQSKKSIKKSIKKRSAKKQSKKSIKKRSIKKK